MSRSSYSTGQDVLGSRAGAGPEAGEALRAGGWGGEVTHNLGLTG